ncbi:MAG: four helix bundle protein [Acidobacteriota bacterium]
MKTFQQLDAFQHALDLMVAVYKATETFPRSEVYGLTSQLRRASTSVVSHIAEGQGRLTRGEWRQFLSQARGSLFEVEAQMLAAHRLSYLSLEALLELQILSARTAGPLMGLIRYVSKQEKAARSRRGA